jgi:hypothetical protein
MKRILTATAIAAALTAGNAQAGSDNKPFNVNITLTSACTLTAVNDLAFTYTSLQPGASTASGGGFSVSCTTSLPYTFKLVQSGGAGGQQVTHTGIVDSVLQLSYDIGLNALGSTGTGVAQPFSVTGTMPGNQAGTCVGATCNNAAATNRTHTLFVNY